MLGAISAISLSAMVVACGTLSGSERSTAQRAPVLPQLYRTQTDAGEQTEVGDAHPVRRGFLLTLLRARLAEGRSLAAGAVTLDDELRKSLEALGYLD